MMESGYRPLLVQVVLNVSFRVDMAEKHIKFL